MTRSKTTAGKKAPQPREEGPKNFATKFHELFEAAHPKPLTAKGNVKLTWKITAALAKADPDSYDDMYSGLLEWEDIANSNESALQLYKVSTGSSIADGSIFEFATNLTRHGNVFYITSEYVYGFGASRVPQQIPIDETENVKLAEFLFSLHVLKLCSTSELESFMTSRSTSGSFCCLLPSSAEILVASDGWRVMPEEEIMMYVGRLLISVEEFFKHMLLKMGETTEEAATEEKEAADEEEEEAEEEEEEAEEEEEEEAETPSPAKKRKGDKDTPARVTRSKSTPTTRATRSNTKK